MECLEYVKRSFRTKHLHHPTYDTIHDSAWLNIELPPQELTSDCVHHSLSLGSDSLVPIIEEFHLLSKHLDA